MTQECTPRCPWNDADIRGGGSYAGGMSPAEKAIILARMERMAAELRDLADAITQRQAARRPATAA